MKMKRLSLMMAATAMATAAMFTACNTGNPKATFKNELDTLGYSHGVKFGRQIASQIQMGQLPVDSAYMADFVRGIREGYTTADDKKKTAYNLGLLIGQNLNGSVDVLDEQIAIVDSTKSVPRNNVLAGFLAALTNKRMQLTAYQADSAYNSFSMKLRAQEMEAVYGANRAEGEEFIAKMAAQEGVQKTVNGVYYKVIKQGNGPTAGMNDRVKLDYEGWLADGTVFDSSIKRNQPAVFSVGSLVPGFSEALKLMPMGSEWEIYIPQELAYGSQKAGQIMPYSALAFKIKTYEIVKE